MKMKSLHDLFVDQLKDLYSAENQLVKALPKMSKAARSGQLTFDFRIDAEPARIIKLRRPKPKEPGVQPLPPATLAEEYFLKGSALDADESRHQAAASKSGQATSSR